MFVDGFRRIELRVVADLDGIRSTGLLGTYGVGTVESDDLPKLLDPDVLRGSARCGAGMK